MLQRVNKSQLVKLRKLGYNYTYVGSTPYIAEALAWIREVQDIEPKFIVLGKYGYALQCPLGFLSRDEYKTYNDAEVALLDYYINKYEQIR